MSESSNKTATSLTGGAGGKGPDARAPTRRSWLISLFWASLIVGVGIAISAIINPFLGRVVHWDWITGLAPAILALFTWALRRRWV